MNSMPACKKTSVVMVALCILLIVIGLPSSGYAADYSLIVGEARVKSVSGIEVPSALPIAARWRTVHLSPALYITNGIVEGDTLTLNLFADTVYKARVDRVSTNTNGTVTVRGRIEGNPLAYTLVSTTGNRTLVEVDIPEANERYVIQSDTSGAHYVADISATAPDELENAAPLVPPAEASVYDAQPNALGPTDPATIDVLMVYTPAARAWADSSGGGINNVIAQAMAKGQLTCDNSDTILTMRLAHSAETSYVESGSSNTDLNRLTNTSDGYMDDVHTLRNQYGGDLVTLLTRVEDTGGLGWLLTSKSGSPSYGFALCRVQQSAGSTYTVIHEQGHNMGCHHSKLQTTEPGPGLFNYSAGWRWVGTNDGKYCSVMTYTRGSYFPDGQDHTAVAYWSNPSVIHQGVPAGNATDGDNARSIRGIKHVIAAYRACTSPSISTHPISQTKCAGQSLTFSVVASGTPDLSYQWRKNGMNVGTNSSSYYIASAQASHAGSYDCLVSNRCGSATSNTAALTVTTGLIITSQPSNTYTWSGGPAVLLVTATGSGTIYYQWRKGGSNISGAIGSSYTITSASPSDSASYDCVLTDACGSATSAAATLTVLTPTATISSAKLIPDGQPVAIAGKPITYTSTDFFYVEETNRGAGIRIELNNHDLLRGSLADLAGLLSTNAEGERFIAATTAAANGIGSVAPLAMGNRALCGADWHYNATAHTGQRGGTDILGLNNVGLLIKTWGNYTKTSDSTFTVSDGYGYPITCLVEPGFPLSTSWQRVTVVGVSSIFKINSITWWPRVLVKDIQTY